MTNRDEFEHWYREEYWDFRYGNLPEIWVEETQSYRHMDVQLAWASWKAATGFERVRTDVKLAVMKMILNAHY